MQPVELTSPLRSPSTPVQASMMISRLPTQSINEHYDVSLAAVTSESQRRLQFLPSKPSAS